MPAHIPLLYAPLHPPFLNNAHSVTPQLQSRSAQSSYLCILATVHEDESINTQIAGIESGCVHDGRGKIGHDCVKRGKMHD